MGKGEGPSSRLEVWDPMSYGTFFGPVGPEEDLELMQANAMFPRQEDG